jgi:hypothetical protein
MSKHSLAKNVIHIVTTKSNHSLLVYRCLQLQLVEDSIAITDSCLYIPIAVRLTSVNSNGLTIDVRTIIT